MQVNRESRCRFDFGFLWAMHLVLKGQSVTLEREILLLMYWLHWSALEPAASGMGGETTRPKPLSHSICRWLARRIVFRLTHRTDSWQTVRKYCPNLTKKCIGLKLFIDTKKTSYCLKVKPLHSTFSLSVLVILLMWFWSGISLFYLATKCPCILKKVRLVPLFRHFLRNLMPPVCNTGCM